jgi:hypothetical protein
MKLTYPTEWSNEVPYSTQMSGISVIYPTGLDKKIFTSNLKSSFRVIKQQNKKFEKAVNGEMILFKLCKLPADESTGWTFGNMALRDKTHTNLCISSFC